MPSFCKPPAVPLFDRDLHHSSVRPSFRFAAAPRGGGGRPLGGRAPARLVLDGRQRGQIPVAAGRALQVSSE